MLIHYRSLDKPTLKEDCSGIKVECPFIGIGIVDIIAFTTMIGIITVSELEKTGTHK